MDHLSYRFGAPTLPQLCEKVGDIIVDIAGHPVGHLTSLFYLLQNMKRNVQQNMSEYGFCLFPW